MAAINLCLEIHQRRDAKNQVSFIFFLLYVFNPFLIFFFLVHRHYFCWTTSGCSCWWITSYSDAPEQILGLCVHYSRIRW